MAERAGVCSRIQLHHNTPAVPRMRNTGELGQQRTLEHSRTPHAHDSSDDEILLIFCAACCVRRVAVSAAAWCPALSPPTPAVSPVRWVRRFRWEESAFLAPPEPSRAPL